MKTIKKLKDVTTLEVGDVVVFGDLKYKVDHADGYFLSTPDVRNDKIFTILNISKKDFVENLGIDTLHINWDFPEVKSLEALTAIVSALFKEYEKQNELPETWEEFCKNTPIQKGECLINAFSEIKETISAGDDRDADEDRTYFTSVQEAKAFLAFMQLRQLRKCYVGNWEPDLDKKEYCGIVYNCDGIEIADYRWSHRSLSFPTEELAKHFLNNFKDLLEIAKPLL